jgi:hypothetical protein
MTIIKAVDRVVLVELTLSSSSSPQFPHPSETTPEQPHSYDFTACNHYTYVVVIAGFKSPDAVTALLHHLHPPSFVPNTCTPNK